MSTDGKNYISEGFLENTLPIEQYDAFQRKFVYEFEPRDARYVRIVAHTIGKTPESHPGAGQLSRMYIDEIPGR